MSIQRPGEPSLRERSCVPPSPCWRPAGARHPNTIHLPHNLKAGLWGSFRTLRINCRKQNQCLMPGLDRWGLRETSQEEEVRAVQRVDRNLSDGHLSS